MGGKEGEVIANRVQKEKGNIGYNAKTDAVYDAQQAIRLVRAHAKDWRIDPNRIGIMGFSAGGHLAATAGTHFDAGNAAAADPIERWHEIVRALDPARLETLLAEDVVFLSPVVHTPQQGKAITTKYLAAALAVLGGADFRYVEQWIGEKSAVLEFMTSIEGIEVNGVDIIGWNAAGRVDSFKVMVRPLKAIEAVRQKMAAALMA